MTGVVGQLEAVNDPRLAALQRLYGKMRGARRNPGTVYCISVEAALADELVTHARREGFQVSCNPSPLNGRKSICVKWPARSTT